jgi:hypothetical protein
LDGLVADDRPLFWFDLWERFKAFEIIPNAQKNEKFITKKNRRIHVLGRKEASHAIPFLPSARAEALADTEQELENLSGAVTIDSSDQSISLASTSSAIPESRSALQPSQDNHLSSNVPAFAIRPGINARDDAFQAILQGARPLPVKRKVGRPPNAEKRKRGRPPKSSLPAPENNSNQ